MPAITGNGKTLLENETQDIYAVYVHLGKHIPKHLLLSLTRHTLLFPTIPCILVVNQVPSVELPPLIKVEMYETTDETDELFWEAGKKIDHNFRSGFWRYTFERIFALQQIHEKYANAKLLHIESDVLLLPNFPWQKFSDFKLLSWMNVNETHDVAALVHLPDLDSTKSLCDFLRNDVRNNPGTTDMYSLLSYAIKNPTRQSYLPSLNVFNSKIADTDIIESNMNSFAHFQGFFDPLALGIWYFGQDPKNNYGKSSRYIDQSHHYLSAPKVQLKYSDGRLFDQHNNEWYSIHLHSKNLKLFGKNWERWFTKYLQEATELRNKNIYSFSAFRISMSDRSIKQHLWHLLAKNQNLRKIVSNPKIESFVKRLKSLLRI